jgi:hypothetical protein
MKPISATAAAMRDQSRDKVNGQFGEQPHQDSGEVQIDQAPRFLDGMTYGGTDHDNVQLWHRQIVDDGQVVDMQHLRLWPDGHQYWDVRGVQHRADGPAIVYPDGREDYYRDGKLHRGDGPAISYPDGREEFYIDGVEVSASDICTATPKRVIGFMEGIAMRGRLEKFTGWDPSNTAKFRTQIEIVNDAIGRVSASGDAVPIIDFPSGSASTPLVGFERTGFIVAQYANMVDLSDNHDAVGVDQAMAIASAILNKRNRMVAEFNRANPVDRPRNVRN